MNYDHCINCNLLPTDAGGITSPDIRLIVHKSKSLTLYSKQILPPQHILRAFLGKTVKFPGIERILCRSSNDHTMLSHLVSKAALHNSTSQNPPIGPKVNSDSPQRTPVSPTRLQDAIIRAK